MTTEMIYQLIRGMHLFASVPNETLQKLAAAMSHVFICGGDYLMKQGEHADALYILARGRLLVTVKNLEGSEHKVGEIGVGDIVGEMALLTDLPRSATVRAVRDCDLIQIDKKLFQAIVKEHTQAAMKVVSECVKRLLPSFAEKKHGVKSISIIPCDAQVNVQPFTEKLSLALQKYIHVKVIRHDDPQVQRYLQEDKTALYAWLSECERQNDLVIYLTEPKLTDFTKLVISQSDKILRVTSPASEHDHELMDYINQSKSILAEKYLIIVHDESIIMPSHTRDILARIPCSEHFHVARWNDYTRLARYLLGRTVSMVFSGGGLRGIAHQGLVQALFERNIPIDMVGGTSFGALPAVFCALGKTPDEMIDVWRSIIYKIKKVIDFTLPTAALGKGQILYELLTEAIPPDIYMDDLWLPAFTVSANISTFKPKMHRAGPAWEAVRASLSIPGIFPPVIDGDDVLVDGASLNNLPVDLMAKLNNQGTIIASVASGEPSHIHYTGYKRGLSGWRLLPDMLTHPEHPIVPSIIETMLTASLAASTSHQAQMCLDADYTLELGVGHYPLMDVHDWEEIRETGYQNAIKQLDFLGLTPEKLGV